MSASDSAGAGVTGGREVPILCAGKTSQSSARAVRAPSSRARSPALTRSLNSHVQTLVDSSSVARVGMRPAVEQAASLIAYFFSLLNFAHC